MLSLLVSLTYSLNTKYPIDRGDCTAWIGTYSYSTTNLKTRKVDHVSTTYQGLDLDFYLKPCSGFQDGDLPFDMPYQNMYSFAVCLRSTCYPLASKYSVDYAPLSSSNFSAGLIISQQSELNYEQTIQTLTQNSWKIEYNLKCDKLQIDPNETATYSVNMKEGLNEITVELPYRGACGDDQKKTPTPTPMYTPQCDYDARDPTEQLQGITMHLQDMNGGPYGHMIHDSFNNKEYWVFYQPCERMHNPANSSDDRYASIWLCDIDMTSCQEMGLVDDHTRLEQKHNNFTSPVYNQIFSETSSRKTTVYWTCKNNVPDNQFIFKTASLSDSDYYLEMTVESRESCRQSMPPPSPNPNQCKLDWLDYHFDATKLNGPDYKGYSQKVTVERDTSTSSTTSTAILHFQPCGGIYCPTDASCDQFEDAYVWLCDERKLATDLYDCDAYGLVEHNASTSFFVPQNPDAGIVMKYKGGDYLSAHVVYECNKNLPEGQVVLDNTVSVSDNILYLTVQTKESCGDNEPATRFIPTWPTKGPTPTPTPLVHAQPNLIVENGTHFIIVDLHDADQTIDVQNFVIAQRNKIASIKHYYAPFQEYGCPSGYNCKEFSENYNATAWMCWTDENNEKVCFPDASIKNEIKIRTIDNTLDTGATITYNGAYHVDLELNIGCDVNADRDIPLNTGASFSQSSRGDMELAFDATSSLVCPHKYDTPRTPKYRPTATPDPAIIENVVFNEDFDEDGHMVELDLTRLPSKIVTDIALGRGTTYEKATLLYSPIEPVTCLEHYDCQGFGPNNVWKCFVNETGQRQCYPLGNVNYGLTLSLAPNQKGIWADVAAVYHGGLNDASTSFLFVCNYSVPEKGVWIDPVGESGYTSKAYNMIYVHSQNVCWNRHVDDDYKKVTGGAIFLAIVFLAPIVYIVCGTIITFFVTGNVHIPQYNFWAEFGRCVATGAVFLGTCGKRVTLSATNYDAI